MNQSEHASLPSRLRFSLKQLEVFVAIAQGGSARSAAQRVARSQSAASAALAELEHTLAVELFDRIGRRLVLNENGRAMLPCSTTQPSWKACSPKNTPPLCGWPPA